MHIRKYETQRGSKFKAIVKYKNRAQSRSFSTKTAAKTWATKVQREWELEAATGIKPVPKLTLQELVNDFLTANPSYAPDRRSQLNWWIKALKPRININDITVDMVEDALKRYHAGKVTLYMGKDKRGRSQYKPTKKKRAPGTVNRMKSALSRVLTYAQKRHRLPFNVCRNIEKLPTPRGFDRTLSDDELARLVKESKNSTWDKLYLLFATALITGARRGELISMTWKQVDFKEKTMILYDGTTKTGKGRHLFMTNELRDLLMQYRQSKGLIFASKIKPNKPFLFRKQWLTVMKEAEVEGFKWHGLRHELASRLARANVNTLQISRILGHSVDSYGGSAITQRYVHFENADLIGVLEKVMGGILKDMEKRSDEHGQVSTA